MKRILIFNMVLSFCLFFLLSCEPSLDCSKDDNGKPQENIQTEISEESLKTKKKPLKTENTLSDKDISASTFIELDYSKFPSLPKNIIPSDKTIFVSKTGDDSIGNGSQTSPFASISKGVHEAKPGFTVVVKQGIYKEAYETGDYRGLVIEKDNITIMSAPSETVEMVPKKEVHTGVVLKGDNIVFRGIHIKDFSTVGILLGRKSVQTNVVLADLVIDGSEEGIVTWGSDKIDNLLVYNVKLNRIGNLGIACGEGPCNNWRIENTSVFLDSKGEGSGADAFAIEKGTNFLIVNSEFAGAAADGIDTKAQKVVIYNCHVHNVARNGIKLWYGGDVINSIIHHTGADASIVVESGDVRFLNTIICYHNYKGPQSFNMTFGYDKPSAMKRVQIINCIIFKTSAGMHVSPNANLKISNSIFFDTAEYVLRQGDEIEITYDNSSLKTFSKYGTGNMFVDPKLDPSFYPLLKSPAIDAGLLLKSNFPKYDKAEKARLKGKAPDIGPFETDS